MTIQSTWLTHESEVGVGNDRSLEHPPQDHHTPRWIDELQDQWGEKLVVDEFDENNGDDDYRSKNGWKGRDLVHDRNSPVRITSYFVKYGPGLDSSLAISNMASTRGGIGTCLTGIVVFTDRAESHRGFCHGGSMCSIMDDVIGWAGFLVSGDCKPWSGFTVQVNTRLTKPIMIHSTLLIQATIRNVEGRKVYIDATLSDPSDDSIHSACEGIFIANKGIIST